MTRRRPHAQQRGFTLIEMLLAGLIGAISIAVAAKVAQVVVQQSAQSRERSDFHSRSRMLTRQLRADLRVAGLGSTGALAFDGASGGILGAGTIVLNSLNGSPAIPAITGVNNAGGTGVGPRTVQAGTDAIQIVVPDSSTAQRTFDRVLIGNGVIQIDEIVPPPPGCSAAGSMVYLVDNSAPTGAGRAQLAFVAGWAGAGPSTLTIIGAMQFTAAAATQVMCARISTYWVDTLGWVHRSDFNNSGDAAITNIGGLVHANAAEAGFDAVSPGVVDLQIAYGMSAEFFRSRGLPPNAIARFAYDGTGAVPALIDRDSTEIRLVRFNMLSRTLRRLSSRPTAAVTAAVVTIREDGAAPAVPLDRGHQAEWITSTEALNNLKIFDEIAPMDMSAEPF